MTSPAGRISTALMLSILNGEHPTAEVEGWVRVRIDDAGAVYVEIIDDEGTTLVTWTIADMALNNLTVDFRGTLRGRTTVVVKL